MYAKIDDNKKVIEFPYNFRRNEDVPSDAVEVDMITNKLSPKWNQITHITSVNDDYVASFELKNRYSSDEEQLEGITVLKRMEEGSNERTFKGKVKLLKEGFTDEEILSWDAQKSEALSYTNDNTVSVPLLETMSEIRGITVEEMVQKVLDRVNIYNVQYGTLLGSYQKNKEILNSIDLQDEETWDLIDSVIKL